jgi:hypothetical protein
MPPAGFEPMIPVFEGLKTVRALDRAAIGTGEGHIKHSKNSHTPCKTLTVITVKWNYKATSPHFVAAMLLFINYKLQVVLKGCAARTSLNLCYFDRKKY